jgi:endonuclease YncB( thermonuclease family)
MNKKASFVLASLITLLIAGNYIFFSDHGIKREKVEIVRVLDGDTVELKDARHIRLLNINTPEKGLKYSELGKNYLSKFSNVELEAMGLDKYDRTLGRLYYENTYLNLEIIKQGFAHTYLVDENEEREFSKAEKYARDNELNIWEKSEFYGCLEVEINKYDEYLDIIDSCDVDIAGWTVKDESTKSYKFESDEGKRFRLYSAKGEDTQEELYWGRGNIWNDDHDEIFIRDNNGILVYYYSYG